MDLSFVIFAVVVIYFVYRGFNRGFLRSVFTILSLVAGYVAAILYAKPVSVALQTQYPMPGIASLITASIILFVGAGIAVKLILWLINKFTAERESSMGSSYGGAAIGLLLGGVVAIVIVWTFAFVRDMSSEGDQSAAGSQGNSIERMAGRVISTTVNTAMSMDPAQPQVAKLTTALLESPADVAKRVQRLSTSNDLQALVQDPRNQAVLNSGNISAVRKLPAFKQLANNPDMLALAKSAGLLDESTANKQSVETALATQVSDIWRRAQRVQNDERVQQILNDPEFQQKTQSGNPMDLFTNTRLLELADIVFSDAATPDPAAVPESQTSTQAPTIKETAMHRWVDKYGRIHFSDEKPKP